MTELAAFLARAFIANFILALYVVPVQEMPKDFSYREFHFPFLFSLASPYRLVGRVVFRLLRSLPSQQALNLLRFALPKELKRKRNNSDERKAQDSPITMFGQRKRRNRILAIGEVEEVRETLHHLHS